ncbi:MAG: undecaprenyldiphospho-muramoylpentapeptide beta-N-acetylglucosaminyltransferase [Actinomycetota bacterium]
MRVVLAGGGTAGHVVPAVALAHALDRDEVLFLGTAKGAEARLVPAAGFRLETIDVRGFDRSKPLSLVATGARALTAIGSARRALRRFAPDVVVGMGGYVSLPACVAARTLGVPIVLHEQNIVFGLANRVCMPLARTVAVSFEATVGQAGARGVFVGNPVPPEIASFDRDILRAGALRRFELDPARRTLLVFGGSQGATRINQAASALPRVWGERADRQVLHITGTRDLGWVSERVATTHGALLYRVVGYVERMTEAYACADLALCRGGATTLAELGVVGLPAIIVPYPHHRDRQQELHARVFERAGAAAMMPDEDTTEDAVAAAADDLLEDDGRLAAMGSAARALGRPRAASALAALVREAAA